MKRTRFILLILVVVFGLWYAYERQVDIPLSEFFISKTTIIHIGEVPLEVEVADTEEERTLGLSGRDSLGDIDGLLFIFDEPGFHGVWMRDMRFPIDVIWIGEDLRIVDITRGLAPESYPRIFEPDQPAKYALETDLILIDTFGISVGNQVRLPEELLQQ